MGRVQKWGVGLQADTNIGCIYCPTTLIIILVELKFFDQFYELFRVLGIGSVAGGFQPMGPGLVILQVILK